MEFITHSNIKDKRIAYDYEKARCEIDTFMDDEGMQMEIRCVDKSQAMRMYHMFNRYIKKKYVGRLYLHRNGTSVYVTKNL